MRAIFFLPALLFAANAWGGECPAPRATEPAAPPIATHGLRIGLALGSGSMHGLAHVGVIREIEARGLDVQVVTGTSVGALFGALWASGMDGARIERLAGAADWSDAGRFSLSREGFLSNVALRDELEPLFGARPIQNWPRRFGAVAANLDDGGTRVLRTGDGAIAVQASSAVPILYRPVVIGGEKLADGALVQPVPVPAARAMGADVVIAVDVAYRPYEEPASGLTGYAFQSMHILINALAAEELRDADVAIRLDVHDTMMHCGNGALVAMGRDAMRRAWPEVESAIAAAARARETP